MMIEVTIWVGRMSSVEFPQLLYKGDNACDFLFAFSVYQTPSEKGVYSRMKNCIFFLLF